GLLAELLGRRVLLRGLVRRRGRLLVLRILLLLRVVSGRRLPGRRRGGRLLGPGGRRPPRLVGRRVALLLILTRRRLVARPRRRAIRALRSAHVSPCSRVALLANTLPGINSHDAAANVVDSAFRGSAQRRRGCGIAHLVE